MLKSCASAKPTISQMESLKQCVGEEQLLPGNPKPHHINGQREFTGVRVCVEPILLSVLRSPKLCLSLATHHKTPRNMQRPGHITRQIDCELVKTFVSPQQSKGSTSTFLHLPPSHPGIATATHVHHGPGRPMMMKTSATRTQPKVSLIPFQPRSGHGRVAPKKRMKKPHGGEPLRRPEP